MEHRLSYPRRLIPALLLLLGCAPVVRPAADVDMLTLRRLPDRLVTLQAWLPSDSVVAPRGPTTVIVSATVAESTLAAKLALYPHLRSDSALLTRIHEAVLSQGWALLQTADRESLQREDFLLIALITAGKAAVRRSKETTLVDEVRLVFWGTCAMANGRAILLVDSTEVLRTLDGWHGCFDA